MKTESSTLPEIAFLFFRQGCLGFGGPVAAMALLESEFQREKGWITPEHYAEMFSVTKILPGPVATQQAIFLGRYRRGFLGGLTAGVFYILPAFLLVMGLSALYLRGGGIAGMDALFGGFQIGVLAIIFLSVWNMSRPYRSGFRNWLLIGVATLVIGRYPRLEPFFIIGAGLFGVFRVWFTNRKVVKLGSFLVFPLAGLFSSPNASANGSATAAAAVTASASVSSSLLSKVFWVCFKAGAFVFGTGLAIVPLLENDTVHQYGWLTHSQFMDGLALGQITPGPVVITATFVGYLAAGFWGGVVATLGMFLPSFINVLVLIPLFWGRWSGSETAREFSAWSFPVVIGGIFGTSLRLGYLTLSAPWHLVLFLAVLGIAFKWRPPSWLLIPATGVLSLVISLLSSL